ncbi:phosphoribosylanthranilate isomerase [Alicyclobacillaceae bacterium I2511]|nr:phosphoribosylanthranilate isomerase [Alicyclobacillaceae bacterium I2511]
MMEPKIKICGLHPEDDFSFTDNERVAYSGFVFVPHSKRFVTPQQIKPVIQKINNRCQTMAVVAGMNLADIHEILSLSGITGVQLHGEEPPTWCDELRHNGYTVWKAIQVPTATEFRHRDLMQTKVMREVSLYIHHVDGILLDASSPVRAPHGVTGGFGKPFAWDIIPTVGSLLQAMVAPPHLWVAGGIHSGNVADLLSVWKPDGLDVSSGVEENGRKSIAKILELIEAVEEYAGHTNIS